MAQFNIDFNYDESGLSFLAVDRRDCLRLYKLALRGPLDRAARQRQNDGVPLDLAVVSSTKTVKTCASRYGARWDSRCRC